MSSPKRPPIIEPPTEDPDFIGYAQAAGARGYGAIPGSPSSAPPIFVAPPAYLNDNDLPDDFKYGVSVANADLAIRLAFVRKVYTILACQLGLTGAVSALFMTNETVKQWVQTNIWAMYLSWLATFGVLFALIVKRRSHPVNLWLLGLFTLLEAYSIGTVVSFFDSVTVLQAVVLTFALFVGLTLFTLQSKYDFSSWGPFLFGTLWVIIIGTFIQIFLPYNSTFNLIIAVATAVLFCAFIVYDTQEIFTKLSPEEYIAAAVELYLDLINLFLAILRILDARD
ncbi:uncharacterized protein SPPG_02570 [Spizellomyces punctatus DAOM BR117]|uniref:Uncharacterized protein n=1 Tax=Spizellomyces punctatus (strain DAOM BR117) TaxID=645134 RepID=A0A0L0HLV6_SPIPD|nr:uncharacterized protein SPPG_02570 [Spizellomyces punctatus DAOM BR117]KND02067.1 hypothetical protein SPPG_02570 [Spizellomyces punctatus DAOM BR117]|eukprot:XP_016610106.1 hypothetical protein SPPG_02570 [Spizellomyces punctatus DAOM BR117]